MTTATPVATGTKVAFAARLRARVLARSADWARRGPAATVAGDLRRWWLVASRPASLRAWRRAQSPNVARVPDGNGWLRRAWLVDNWTTGVLAAVLSVALYLAAGGTRWLAGHPARRWVALLMAAGFGVWTWST